MAISNKSPMSRLKGHMSQFQTDIQNFTIGHHPTFCMIFIFLSTLSFQLPSVSEVIPPPSHMPTVPECTVPNPQRPIIPLFPKGCFPKKSGPDPKPKSAPPKVSSRRRKNYWRSVLHKATLATSSLPPPTNGSLRQAAQACVQRMQAASVSAQNTKKRELPTSSPILSPSNSSPLAQRIRLDLQIGEREGESPEKYFEIDGNEVDQVESPEKELLRSHPSRGVYVS